MARKDNKPAKARRTAATLAIESRRTRVAEAFLQGYRTVRAIAAVVKSSAATVTRDLQEIQAEWKAAAITDFDAARAEELQRIDRIERTAWAEWERSKTERGKTQRRTRKTNGVCETIEAAEREGRLGDPRYLERIGWCIDRRIKLLGLDAPERHELSGPAGGPIHVATADQLSDDDLAAIAAGGNRA